MSGINRRSYRQTLELMASMDIKTFTLNRRQQRELARSVLRALGLNKTGELDPEYQRMQMEINDLKFKINVIRGQNNDLNSRHRRMLETNKRLLASLQQHIDEESAQ